MQLSKITTFQLTFSNGADEKSCVFEINRTSTFSGKISMTTGLKFCIDSLHCKGSKIGMDKGDLKGIHGFKKSGRHLEFLIYDVIHGKL